MKFPDIIFFSFFPWHSEFPSTAHGLAAALAAHTRVWYVSKPPTFKDQLKNALAGRENNLPEVESIDGHDGKLKIINLDSTLSINKLPSGSLYTKARNYQDKLLNKQLRTILEAHHVGDFVWINVYAPTYFLNLNLHRTPLKRVYYTVDDLESVSYTAKHGVHAQRKQLKRADFALATSLKLQEKYQEFSKQIWYLPNAVDTDGFKLQRGAVEPDDLKGISHPRAGYIGNLDTARVDFNLLLALAESKPDIQLILIGPWNGPEEVRIKFELLANVYLLGLKTKEECARYLQFIDLGMIPFNINEQTAAIYPLKINEYLATGLPVMSTNFSCDIQQFEELIFVGPASDWIDNIDTQLARTEERAVRIETAAENSWAARARTFLKFAGYPIS